MCPQVGDGYADPSTFTIPRFHSVPLPHVTLAPSPISHVTDLTRAVNDIRPAVIVTGPQVVGVGSSAHNHTGKPTRPIESGVFANGVMPTVIGSNCTRATSKRAICCGDT